jgi:CDP-paratose 2-epimerase
LSESKQVLVTGGAGFIGSHAARSFLDRGAKVRVYDNMSRVGSDLNLGWVKEHPAAPGRLEVVTADVRDADAVAAATRNADLILHAAGQTAVTKSVANPRDDFESNALGTLNVLEGARASGRQPVVIYPSTNKVYGGMESAQVELADGRYRYAALEGGTPESWPLDFHSPYGCSKGAADQYVRDYARIYDLPTIVFRQSCIYGTWQFGTEDQGWLAHFIVAAVLDLPLTIYGDGRQVRDVLFIDDLTRAFHVAVERVEVTAGEVYNIGGGPDLTLSLLELIGMLEELRGQPMRYEFDDWRPGDQRVYVSDIGKARADFGWLPEISVEEGVRRLYGWAQANRDLLVAALARTT